MGTTIKQIINPIYVEGITLKVGLNPNRITEYKEIITELIKELPSEFKDGMSFLRLCINQNGDMWTTSHKQCEKLMILGIATGKMRYCCPKNMWSILPGGVPYIQTLLEK